VRLDVIAEKLGLTDLTPELPHSESVDVSQGHASDLLSDVLANADPGALWVTIQVHLNVVAVAVHAGLTGIIFASGRMPDDAVRQKALEEQVRLYGTDASTFDTVGRLYDLGLRGATE